MTLAQLEPSAQAPCTSTTLVALTGAACAAGLIAIRLAAPRAAARVSARNVFIAGSVLVPSGIAHLFDMEELGVTPRHNRLIAAARSESRKLTGWLHAARSRAPPRPGPRNQHRAGVHKKTPRRSGAFVSQIMLAVDRSEP